MSVVFQITPSDKIIPVNISEKMLSLFNPYSEDTNYNNKSFYEISQDSIPFGVFLSPDGKRMFVIGNSNDEIYSYTLDTPWDVTTANYDKKSFYVGRQESYPRGLYFSPDGKRMYIVGTVTNKVYSYTLDIPWDISTATYDDKSFYVGNQEICSAGLFFSPEGKHMFIVGPDTDSVYSYTLGTPWDIGTAIYDNKSFSVEEQEDFPTGIYFSSDGKRMFILGNFSDKVYSYTLSTPWDISTANYAGKSFYVGFQENSPHGLFFSIDGTRLFIIGFHTGKVYSYKLSSAWDISTANYGNNRFCIDDKTVFPYGMFFKPDGSGIFIINYGTDEICFYTLSNPWDVTTAKYDGKSFHVGNQESYPTGISISPDGKRMFIIGNSTRKVYYYILNTPWDITTAKYENENLNVSYEESYPTGIFFQSDGTRLFIVGNTNNKICSYSLSIPWDISTATYDDKSSIRRLSMQ